MKKVINLAIALVMFAFMLNEGNATRPQYTIYAKNFNFPTPNQMVFDIYITCTNTADTVLQYALGQYYFNFDTTFCAGGTISYGYYPSAPGDSSDLPFSARPRTPTRILSTLRLNSNNALGLGNGPIIPGTPGKKVIRMVLTTSATAFASNNPADSKLRWRNANAGNPFTKIFAYVGNLNTEITDSTGHFVDFPTGISEPGSSVASIIPKEFSLSQNFPNPFNPSTKIEYALPTSGNVNLKIYDLTGREIQNLVSEFKTPGTYSVQFNATGLASGMYFYRIIVQGEKSYDITRKMMLIK
ncbi:MAG TPA: T9SS type A sorting domain-containing protein [Ignavibacteria bacterium]|nr:T9SS type A sorting domain-containing protein [Ignavibacteria bacterium]